MVATRYASTDVSAADTTAPILAPAVRRAKRDPIATLLAKATAHGVQFRLAGATLHVTGADTLHPDDRACLRRYIANIRLRLEPPAPALDLLDQLDVEVEVITDAGRAEMVLGQFHGRGTLGFDIETAPLDGNGSTSPWLRITKDGRRAKVQPYSESDVGLDPFRSAPRLASIYDPTAATVYVIDLRHVPITALAAIEDLPLYIHNSTFEHAALAVHGIRLRRTYCTLQLARLTYGAERGGLRLTDIAPDLLGIDLPKDEQVSDWGAERLSESQLQYAAADAVATHRVGKRMWQDLDRGARRAFRLGNATVPVVADMRLAGIPFDVEIHRATIACWERQYTAARSAFIAITGEEPPAQGRSRNDWLEVRLPEDMCSWWPRTTTGLLRTRSADLDRLAAVPEVRPLLDVIGMAKRLQAFGHSRVGQSQP
jgi:hypothetical protein